MYPLPKEIKVSRSVSGRQIIGSIRDGKYTELEKSSLSKVLKQTLIWTLLVKTIMMAQISFNGTQLEDITNFGKLIKRELMLTGYVHGLTQILRLAMMVKNWLFTKDTNSRGKYKVIFLKFDISKSLLDKIQS